MYRYIYKHIHKLLDAKGAVEEKPAMGWQKRDRVGSRGREAPTKT